MHVDAVEHELFSNDGYESFRVHAKTESTRRGPSAGDTERRTSVEGRAVPGMVDALAFSRQTKAPHPETRIERDGLSNGSVACVPR